MSILTALRFRLRRSLAAANGRLRPPPPAIDGGPKVRDEAGAPLCSGPLGQESDSLEDDADWIWQAASQSGPRSVAVLTDSDGQLVTWLARSVFHSEALSVVTMSDAAFHAHCARLESFGLGPDAPRSGPVWRGRGRLGLPRRIGFGRTRPIAVAAPGHAGDLWMERPELLLVDVAADAPDLSVLPQAHEPDLCCIRWRRSALDRSATRELSAGIRKAGYALDGRLTRGRWLAVRRQDSAAQTY
jgi:hypothetical protein